MADAQIIRWRLFGITGDPIGITAEDVKFFPIIQHVIDMFNNFGETPEDDIIRIPFSYETISYYYRWCRDNSTSLEFILWRDVIKILEIAVFVENEHFMRYFTFKIIPRILNEENIFVIRYLLSFSGSSYYLECSYNEDDWDYEPFWKHSFEEDCVLDEIPIEILKPMFLTLSPRKRTLLLESITKHLSSDEECVVGHILWYLQGCGTTTQTEEIFEFDLSDQNDRLNNI